MAKQTFNREPYFDDYDQNKNFHKILFRPRRSIQTRELNQIQSILGGEIETFANHIFKFGSMVKTGVMKYSQFANYVTLKDLTPTSQAIDVSYFVGRRCVGATSGLIANVTLTMDKDDFDPATIFVDYENSAIDGTTQRFINGETLQVLDDQGYVIYEAVVRCPSCLTNADTDNQNPTGLGSQFTVADAAYYVHGHFVTVPNQSIYLDKYSTESNYQIGFDIVQSIVTSDDDISLLDNALGSPNFVAPGADRYKIELVLTKKPYDVELDNENFILLAKVKGGYLQEIRDKPQYGDIMEMIARRTYDESGDYTVRAFTLNFREHLKENGNNGLFLAANGGDTSKFIIQVSPGKAYVRGREIEYIANSIIEVDKARDSEYKRSSVVRSYIGNYITVKLDPVGNVLPITDVTASNNYAVDFGQVNLYDGASSGGNYSGNQVGTARVKGIELQEGDADDVDAIWRLYLFEIVLNTDKTLQDVVGLHRTGGGSQTFSANIEPDPSDGITNKIYDPNNNVLLWNIPFSSVKSIRDADNPLVSNTSVTIIKKLVGAVNSQNKVVFSAEGDETFLDFDAETWVGGLQTGGASGNFLPYDLTVLDRVVATPTQITIQNFNSANQGKNFVLIFEVLKSNAKEKTKTLDTKYLNDIAGNVTTINLQVADAYKLVSVTDVTDVDPQNHVDVTANYTLKENQRDNYYGLSYLELNAGIETPDPGTLLDIEVQYFEHSGTGYYFSADSYNTIINDPTIDFDYEDIPKYTSNKGSVYSLSDTLDFRPSVGTDGTFSHASATLTNLPVDNSNIIFDVEYYLPRIDLLCLGSDGYFKVAKGAPSLTPKVPVTPEASMPLYQIHINAYTYAVPEDVKFLYLDNRRYTMRDIGRLAKRIEKLEYYVTFNSLEKATADQQILDSAGNDRFKNGFLVDNFRDFTPADNESSEYASSIDITAGELRPSFHANAVKMELNTGSSSHYVKKSKILCLPYDDVQYIEQPYATKTISCAPYFSFARKGEIVLNPSSDIWKDTTQDPARVVSIDATSAAQGSSTIWGEWETTNSQVVGQSSSSSQSGTTTTTTTTTTTATNQNRTGTTTTYTNKSDTYNLGNYVTSVNNIPYCRSISISFVASKMKERTRLYAFFDDVDVTKYCRPLNGGFGQPLVTDTNGQIQGIFTIPNNSEDKFFTGRLNFLLTNSATNSEDSDELTTYAETTFYANGLQETSQATVLSVTTTQTTTSVATQSRTVTSSSENTSSRNIPTVIRRNEFMDPIAQSFIIHEEQGVFLTGCDLYFSEKHPTQGVWFEIRNMINGYPGTAIVPFSHVVKKSENINVSANASVATRFTFQAPVYLQPDTEYCFIVGSDVEDNRVYAARLGGTTIQTPNQTVNTQPSMGSLFKGQNNRTWTAQQEDDLMFRLYRAEFDNSSDMDLTFSNAEYGLKTAMETNPFETETGSRMVRVYMKNHGLNVSDKVKLELLQDTAFQMQILSGNVVVGQQLVGGTNGATAIIKELEDLGSGLWNVKLSELKGFFADGEQFTGPVFYEEFGDDEVLASLDISATQATHNVAVGNFPTGVDNTFNGIPLSDLSTPEHLVQAVDSMDSFVIQVDTEATADGRVGGSGVYAVGNIQTDAFDLQVEFMDFRGDADWAVTGITHAAVGSNVSDYAAVNAINFSPNATTYLPTPMKIASFLNQDFILAGNASLNLSVSMGSDNTYISPMINLETLTFTSITNRVEWNTCSNYSIAPLADSEGNPVICDITDPSYTGTHRWKYETDYDGGSELAKYLMKPVTLTDPATNLKVYMDLLTFLDTEVQLYYRTLPAELDETIYEQEWVQHRPDQDVISEADSQFNEVEYTVPSDVAATLPEFKAFQVKLVMRSKNTARPPKVKNFRAMAVL